MLSRSSSRLGCVGSQRGFDEWLTAKGEPPLAPYLSDALEAFRAASTALG